MKKLNLNTIVTKFKETTLESEHFNSNHKLAISIILILGLTAFLIQFNRAGTPPLAKIVDNSSLDTFIPDDQGLVTIQVANYESLDQIIGQYGVVDLYSTPLLPGEKARLIIRKVKMVRSLKSLRHFNVLLPANEVGVLAGHPGEFTVSVRNPKLIGTKIVKSKARPKKRRVYFQ